MNKYRCQSCSYIYDPSENDGKDFKDLPEDWTCPSCGAAKSKFEIVHHLGEEYTGGEAQEKHVPVIEVNGTTVTVKVGAIPHPMLEEHYITSIELYDGKTLLEKKELQPGEEPIAIFENVASTVNLHALEHCNMHGAWESRTE